MPVGAAESSALTSCRPPPTLLTSVPCLSPHLHLTSSSRPAGWCWVGLRLLPGLFSTRNPFWFHPPELRGSGSFFTCSTCLSGSSARQQVVNNSQQLWLAVVAACFFSTCDQFFSSLVSHSSHSLFFPSFWECFKLQISPILSP